MFKNLEFNFQLFTISIEIPFFIWIDIFSINDHSLFSFEIRYYGLVTKKINSIDILFLRSLVLYIKEKIMYYKMKKKGKK